MSETLIPAAEAGVEPQMRAFDPKAALGSVALSLFVNGVLPFAVYRLLVSHFPSGSIMPLLYASAFPVLGLTVGFIRTRSLDVIAMFALFGISYSIATTILAGEVRLALILGATQAFLISGAFLASALIRRPIIYFIVRQFSAGNDPAMRAQIAAVNEADGMRTCTIASLVWAVGIALLGALSIVLAVTLEPATYLLVNNIVNTAINILLVVWTIRFVRPRLTRAGERLAAAAASAN